MAKYFMNKWHFFCGVWKVGGWGCYHFHLFLQTRLETSWTLSNGDGVKKRMEKGKSGSAPPSLFIPFWHVPAARYTTGREEMEIDTFVAVSHLCRISPQIEKENIFFFMCGMYPGQDSWSSFVAGYRKGKGGKMPRPAVKWGQQTHTPSSLTLLIRFELPGHEKKI